MRGTRALALAGVAAVLMALLAIRAEPASGAQASASYYGPGLYGNALACAGMGTLQRGRVGVAHRWLPCGSWVTICYGGRCLRFQVIDRGPFVAGREFDLTEAAAAQLCRCYWGVRTVTWWRS